MVVSYSAAGDTFRPLKPELWSDVQFSDLGTLNRYFDLHPDGRRFVVVKSAETSESRINKVMLILNFFEELRRLAPPAN
jgi:hypothetical protein